MDCIPQGTPWGNSSHVSSRVRSYSTIPFPRRPPLLERSVRVGGVFSLDSRSPLGAVPSGYEMKRTCRVALTPGSFHATITEPYGRVYQRPFLLGSTTPLVTARHFASQGYRDCGQPGSSSFLSSGATAANIAHYVCTRYESTCPPHS
jgi:hypothetical protein